MVPKHQKANQKMDLSSSLEKSVLVEMHGEFIAILQFSVILNQT